MNNSTLWSGLLAALCERAAITVGTILVADNLLPSDQAANFEHLLAGFLVAAVGIGVAFYREYGRAWLKHKFEQAQIAAKPLQVTPTGK